MSCDKCPGCGQFCNYPECMPGYVPPKPVDLEQLRQSMLLHAATWEQRMATREQLKDINAR